jgi:16S rRNA (cytosine1402-N4)-methyltransferase
LKHEEAMPLEEASNAAIHIPVLAAETITFLQPELGGVFIDATLGMGGHSAMILKACAENRLIGIDQDAEAISYAKEKLNAFGERFRSVQANFSAVKNVWQQSGWEKPAGILADLGVSSLQFDSAERGFSFRFDAPLDMRMNPQADTETAADLLAALPEAEIARIIYEYGEERGSRKIARWIVERRDRGEAVKTTGQLAELVARALKKGRHEKVHPATRTFQALRVAVNRELEILGGFLRDAVEILDAGGRLAVITFHSLEDRIVKRTMQNLSGKCFCPPRLPECLCGATRAVEILTRRAVSPTETEIAVNARARSAKLRACQKLPKSLEEK